MKKIFLFTALILSLAFHSQILENKIASEVCKCINKIEKRSDFDKETDTCFFKGLENNKTEILKKLNDPNNKIQKDIEDYLVSIEGLVLSNCPTFLKYREKDIVKPEKQSISKCDDIKIGTYFYNALEGREIIYLTFTQDNLIETRKNNINSVSKLDWIENCTYKINIVKTNSNYDELNVKNKPLVFKIIENNSEYFVVQTKYFDNGGYTDVKIYKLPYQK